MLGAMALSVAMFFVTGSPRVLLIRNAWGTAAMGLWTLATLFARRPFLHEGGRMVLADDQQQVWAHYWEKFAPFRHVSRVCTGVWGDLNTTRGTEIARELDGLFVPADVGTLEDNDRVVAAAVTAFGRLSRPA